MIQFYGADGGRPIYNNDIELLQEQVDKAAKGLYFGKGAFILYGCFVTGSGPYNISSGLVYINNEIMEFDAVTGVTMPYYIYQDTVSYYDNKPYKDNVARPTKKLIKAIGSNVMPLSGENITMSSGGGRSFWDANDNQVMRLSGSQTAAGNKTFTGATTLSGNVTLSSNVAVSGTVTTNVTGTGYWQGTRFISTTSTGTAPLTVSSTTAVTNLNADMVDGYHASTFLSADSTLQSNINALSSTVAGLATVPPGVIFMWSGSVGSIPSGYFLCNGDNGTPNLTNRFVFGQGTSYAVGATGGATSKTLSVSELPSHNHSMTSAGNHQHYMKEVDSGEEGNDGVDQSIGSYTEGGTTKYTSYAGDHVHSIGYVGSNQAFSIMPPYMALCYIMKA